METIVKYLSKLRVLNFKLIPVEILETLTLLEICMKRQRAQLQQGKNRREATPTINAIHENLHCEGKPFISFTDQEHKQIHE